MISTQSTGDRRLTPSQREALGKFVPNPFPPAQKSTPVRQTSSEPLPMRPPEFDSYARKCLFLLERTFKNATTTAPAAPASLVFRFLRHEAPHSVPC